MRHRELTLALLAPVLLLGLPGCTGTGEKGRAGSSPEATFYAYCKAVTKGNMEEVYGFYSDRKRGEISLAQLKEQFAAGPDVWRVKYSNARVRQVIDDKKGRASMVVLYGDGQRLPVMSYVLDGDVWKIDND